MTTKRNAENGVLQFHKGTEKDLMRYVLQYAENNNPQSVVDTIDKFCWQNHWMMHVGDEKGRVLSDVTKKRQPLNVLELGTYCGYSALVMLLQMDNPSSKVYTIDPNVELINDVTTQILQKAGVLNRVVFLDGYSNDVINNELSKLGIQFDLVFLDHHKQSYYSDLLLLEKYGLVNKNTVLVADNVIVFNINDYLNYVLNKEKFKTEIFYTSLEYNNDKNDSEVHRDGVVVSSYV